MKTIIVVGAARSGTKLVRDILASVPGGSAVPFDINYIWRLGNESVPHDELTLDHVTSAKTDRIRRYVGRHGRSGGYVVEKTVATPLRIPFVNAIFPEAEYVFLIRDPVDVVESVRRQWLSDPNWRYVLTKSRSFPFFSAPRYAMRESRAMLRRSVGAGEKSVWGVRYNGIGEDIEERSLLEVCALQWRYSMMAAIEGFKSIGVRPTTISYEALCDSPDSVFATVFRNLELPAPRYSEFEAINAESVGLGSLRLTSEERGEVRSCVEPVLEVLRSDQDHLRWASCELGEWARP